MSRAQAFTLLMMTSRSPATKNHLQVGRKVRSEHNAAYVLARASKGQHAI